MQIAENVAVGGITDAALWGCKDRKDVTSTSL